MLGRLFLILLFSVACNSYESSRYYDGSTAPKGYYNQPLNKLGDEKLKATPLSPDQAQMWFKFLALQSDIPFRYVDDGCYARAHRMAEIMEAHGVTSLKIFIFSKDENTKLFKIKNPYVAQGFSLWTYHVAPAVLVQDGDKFDFMVIDPSLMSRAVVSGDWLKTIGSTNGNEYTFGYYPRFAYMKDQKFSDFWSTADLSNAKDLNRKNLALQQQREAPKSTGSGPGLAIAQ